MVISAVIKALGKAALEISKKRALGKTGTSIVSASKQSKVVKSLSKSFGKALLNKSGFGRFGRALKDINNLMGEDFKGSALKQVLRANPLISKTYKYYQREKDNQWKSIGKKIDQEMRRIERETIKEYKDGNGIEFRDFTTFKNWYIDTLSPQEQQFAQNIFKDKLRLIFNSNWIMFAIFIPYGKNSKSGILGIQIYNRSSKNNPSLFYNYIRIPMWVWERLENNPSGKEFWDAWLRKNRTNRRYLTKQSIYYNNKK